MCKPIDITVDPSDRGDVAMAAMSGALIRAVARGDVTPQQVDTILMEAGTIADEIEGRGENQEFNVNIKGSLEVGSGTTQEQL